MEFQAVVMAAGQGSRLNSLTAKLPKALLPVANKPLVYYPLKLLETAGFEEILIVVNEDEENIVKTAVTEVCAFTMSFDFIAINNDDCGTADTLRRMRDKIKTDLLIVSCDLIVEFPLHQLADVHRLHDATVTMLLCPSLNISDVIVPGGKANKTVERDVIGLDLAEKNVVWMCSESDLDETVPFRISFLKTYPYISMHTDLTDAHLYFMKRSVLDYLDKEKSISSVKGELIPYLVKKQFFSATRLDSVASSLPQEDNNIEETSMQDEDYIINLVRDMSTWADIKSNPCDVDQSRISCCCYVLRDQQCIRANNLPAYCEANRQRCKLQCTAEQADTASTGQRATESLLGNGVTFGEKVSIKWSIIGNHCKVGDKVKILNCIIMDHATIENGVSLTGCIVCDHTKITGRAEMKDCIVGSGQTVEGGKHANEMIMDAAEMLEI